MVTVGEMVKERAKHYEAELLRECPEAANSSVSSLTAMWLKAIRSLGIWDAEVLECEFLDDACGDRHLVRIDPEHLHWNDLAEEEQRVRVIVLKEE